MDALSASSELFVVFKSGSAIRTGSLTSSKVIWWWVVVVLDAAAPVKVKL
jgi:hypothetical protein